MTLVVSDSINFPEYDEIEKRNKGKGTGDKERKWVVTVSGIEERRGERECVVEGRRDVS